MKPLIIFLLAFITLVASADLADKAFCDAGVSVCASKCCGTIYKSNVAAKTALT